MKIAHFSPAVPPHWKDDELTFTVYHQEKEQQYRESVSLCHVRGSTLIFQTLSCEVKSCFVIPHYILPNDKNHRLINQAGEPLTSLYVNAMHYK